MKIRIILIILLTYSTAGICQSKDEIEAKEFFWGAEDKYKNVNEIPDKWKNESAVIIYKNVNYDYHKFGKNVTYKTSVRKRIKLLDKAAVDEFSEFSFKKRFKTSKINNFQWGNPLKGKNIVKIKIIKEDGEEVEVDVDNESVEVDGETKIAVSNLEVGDIIDFFIYRVEPHIFKFAFGFDPVETTLGEEYPIVDFKLFFETENDFFINFNSYNGAPELMQIPTDKNNFRRYELVASNIEKNDFPIWFFPLIELPSYKFQVYFARSGKFEDRAMAFLPEKENIIKKSVTKEEVLDLYEQRFKPAGDVGDVKHFFKEKTFENDTEKVKAAYYYMRHYYLTRFVEAFYVREVEILNYPFIYYGNDVVFIKYQKQFIRHFTEFLKDNKIGYEIVVAKKRYDGTINDLLIEENVQVLLKVNTAESLYVEFFGPHTNVNEYSPLIEDTDVYLLTSSKGKIIGVEDGKMPVSTHFQNESKKEISLNVEEDFSKVLVSSISKFKGHSKVEQQYEKLSFNDYVHEDYKIYETQSFIEMIRKKKDKVKYGNELSALVDKLKEKQKEKFIESAKEDFDFIDLEDYEYEINENGRYSLDSYFTYTEKFKVDNNLIKKAGANYIIEIGKFIGEQTNFSNNKRQRTENIHMNYPRTYSYEIKLNIPNGYTVLGLENFNKSVDNLTGAFISSAKVENNILIVNTTKQYKHNFEPVSNWNLMLQFLDEAHQFTNEKILLKKNE